MRRILCRATKGESSDITCYWHIRMNWHHCIQHLPARFFSFSFPAVCDPHRGLGRTCATHFFESPSPFPASPVLLCVSSTCSSHHASSVTSVSAILTLHTIHVSGALTVSMLPDCQPLNSPRSVLAWLSIPIGYHLFFTRMLALLTNSFLRLRIVCVPIVAPV